MPTVNCLIKFLLTTTVEQISPLHGFNFILVLMRTSGTTSSLSGPGERERLLLPWSAWSPISTQWNVCRMKMNSVLQQTVCPKMECNTTYLQWNTEENHIFSSCAHSEDSLWKQQCCNTNQHKTVQQLVKTFWDLKVLPAKQKEIYDLHDICVKLLPLLETLNN